MTIELSVGIPAYNQADYLVGAVQSVLDQVPAPHELVVCDNHSTDHTAEVLRRFGDRIRVVRPERHLSIMANWNHTVASLRGAWVALLSSDDLAAPGFAAALRRGALQAADAVLVRARHEDIDAAGNRLGFSRKRPVAVDRAPTTVRQRLYSPATNPNAMAFRREAWHRVGGFREAAGFAGDWALQLDLAAHGSFVTIADVVTRYRVHHRTTEQEHARAYEWARGFQFLYHEVLPAVAEQVGGIHPAEIRVAMRARCVRLLVALGGLPPEMREELGEGLVEWARACDVEQAFARFRAGKLPHRPRFRSVRMWLARLGIR